ncbi:MAG: hypothetical protein J6V68_04525 [Clostridia bacterium]|nr:hypothetical protein [Clostridia bacterium]
MLIDLHTHTSGISFCARKDFKGMIEDAKAVNLDGFVLTNHICDYYPKEHGLDYKGFCEKYYDEYLKAKEYGDKNDFKVFFGIEVTMGFHPEAHLLIYGADEKFLFNAPKLYSLSQKELFEIVDKNGYALVQGHPYRNNYHPLDTNYLHGVEVNCHPKHNNMLSELFGIAKQSGVCLTCGGDYHADVPYRPSCGVYLPDTVKTGKDIANFLRTTKSVKLRVHKPNEPDFFEKVYDLR